jgi:deoxyribodipyrimidine photolyase-related protein
MEHKHTIRWHKLVDPKKPKSIPKSWFKDIKEVHIMDPVDSELLHKVTSALPKSVSVTILESPLFLFDKNQLESYVKSKDNKMKRVLHHSSFYSWSRKQLHVLMTDNHTVEGGKLSFDTSNRKPLSI